jgi:hypothetical protein
MCARVRGGAEFGVGLKVEGAVDVAVRRAVELSERSASKP